MSTPPMPPAGPEGPQQPQGQPYPQQPQGQFPQAPQGQFPQGQFPQGQPYPQAPQGQFPGAGPVPGTGPQAGFQPGPGQPQPFPQAPMGTPPKKSRRLLAGIGGAVGVIVVVIIVRVVIGLGVSTAVSSADDAHNTAVGDCATVSGTLTSPKYDKADCTSDKANYTVGQVIKSSETCAEGYDSYYESGTLNNVKVCLAPIFKDGGCYKMQEASQDMGYPSLACTDPDVDNVQVKVVKDKADKSACENPTAALAYPALKLTYCLAKPSGA
ncbi:hypothetical protein [Kutzneria sp. NPDC051319]|uniref:LppU/SCO3897 family protein n=1 Tax=Kutzneria sp. NPDC051319 TaxID=3155047 RepID=UPI00344501BB